MARRGFRSERVPWASFATPARRPWQKQRRLCSLHRTGPLLHKSARHKTFASSARFLLQESEQSLGAEKDVILKDQEESQKAFVPARSCKPDVFSALLSAVSDDHLGSREEWRLLRPGARS